MSTKAAHGPRYKIGHCDSIQAKILVTVTLNITVVRPDLVCQVSDTRFTTSTAHQDYINKVIVLECLNGIMSCSYSGIGVFGDKRTDMWLSEVLLALSKNTVGKVIEGIASAANEGVTASLMELYRKNSLSHMLEFNLGGWGKHRERGWLPFSATVSNMWNGKSERMETPGGFTTQISYPTADASAQESVSLRTGGVGYAIDIANWDKLLKAGKRAKVEDLIRLMVKTVVDASQTKGYGRYISSQCLSVVLDNQSEIQACFHAADGTTRAVIPMCVRPGMAVGGGEAQIPEGWSIKVFPRDRPNSETS